MKRILIVDDEPAFTRIVKLTLERAGDYEVSVENDPCKALRSRQDFNPDVTILDVAIPEVNDLEVAEALRELWRTRQGPIVILTAADSADDSNLAHELMMDGPVLAKPVNLEELIEIIDRVTSGEA